MSTNMNPAYGSSISIPLHNKNWHTRHDNLSINHRVVLALVQHIHIELALANLAARGIQALGECIKVHSTSIFCTFCGSRTSCSSWNSFVLNSARTHHTIDSSVRNCTSSTKSHTLSNGCTKASKHRSTTTT